MGEIYSVYDILPDGDEADLKVQKAEVVDHVFGLMKIHAEFLINADDEMIGSKLEDALTSIEGVGNIECVSSTNV